MGRMTVVRRGRRRGGAMLELALLLPIYMLVFYIVWTMGDVGGVSSQAHLGARYAAWKRVPASAYTVQKTVAGQSLRATPRTGTFAVTGYAHQPNNAGYVKPDNMSYWVQHSNVEMYAYNTYSLAQPLPSNGRATPESGSSGGGGIWGFIFSLFGSGSKDKEPSLDDMIKKHEDNFVSSSTLNGKYPVAIDEPKNFRYSTRMLAAAMEGDSSYGEEIPWLRRNVARASFTMRGVGGITSTREFYSTHTVLLGIRYNTMIPKYYDEEFIGLGESINSQSRELYYDCVPPPGHLEYLRNLSRNPMALRNEFENKSMVDGGRLHQLHFIKARGDLTPAF